MTSEKTTNARHSIALVAIAGEFVVSCFPVVNGVPDTDREIFVETFTDEAAARRFYTRKSALLACTAAMFDAEISSVYDGRASLASCLCREVPNESRRLRAAMAELELCTLARRSEGREAHRARALQLAAETLAARSANLDGRINAEAEKRASLGQP